MNMELLFPSLYLKAADLQELAAGRDVVVTIEKVVLDELVMRGGARKKKGVIHLRGKEKMLVLNRTNAELIAGMYGRDTDAWLGKPIALYATRVGFGRETVDAIRVREKAPQQRAKNGDSKAKAPPPAEAPTGRSSLELMQEQERQEQDQQGDAYEPGSEG
jgi:hypothetical protein